MLREVAETEPAALRDPAGLPGAEEAVRMASALHSRLW
jgi:hypothetical protein